MTAKLTKYATNCCYQFSLKLPSAVSISAAAVFVIIFALQMGEAEGQREGKHKSIDFHVNKLHAFNVIMHTTIPQKLN